MEKIDYEVDDFMNYCDYKGLSPKSMRSYEQTLRLFIRYLKDECNITSTGEIKEQTIKQYISSIKERGKYTVIAEEKSRRINNPQNRQDFGKKVSLATVNNYTRNLRVYFNYMYDNRLIKLNPMKNIKTIKIPRKVVGYMEDKDFKNLLSGGDIYTLSKILGHSSVQVTEQAYLDLDTEDLRQMYQKHSPLMNLKKT